MLSAAGQDFKITDNVDYVLLDVAVHYPDGSFATGLTQSNFAVYEDGSPRKITYFSEHDRALAIGLVVDNSGSMAAKRRSVVMAGLAFAKESNLRDEFFVINFNDSVTRGLPASIPFTDNLQLLKQALYFGEAKGRTALYDAIAYGLKHLELSKEQRRTLIVVSDGRDNASKLSYAQLKSALEASRATLYTIALREEDSYETSPRVLRRIAHLTGGEFFAPANEGEILPVFNRIANDLRHRYSIEYAPDEVHDEHEIRTVKVVARTNEGRKLKTRTRTTYSVGKRKE